MKKALSIFLSLLLTIASLTVVQAADESLEVSGISTVYSVKVTAKTAKSGSATIKVFPINLGTGAIDYTQPVYLGQLKAPTTPAAAVGEKNTYEFKFDLLTTQAEGDYCAIVNNETAKAWKFKFISPYDRYTYYKELKEAGVSEIETKLTATTGRDFDLGGYTGYTAAIKSLINAQIDAVDTPFQTEFDQAVIDGSLSEGSNNYKLKYVEIFEKHFKPKFEELLTIAKIETCTDATEFDGLIKGNRAFGFDMTFYNNNILSNPASDVCNRAKNIMPATFAKEDVKKAFDMSVLLAVIDTSSAGTVTTALEHYNTSGSITLDKTYSGSFTETQQTTLSGLLQTNKASLTAANLEAKYLEYSQDVAEGNGPGVPSAPAGDTRPGATSPTPVAPIAPDGSLSDLGEAEWAKEAIEYLVEKDVLSGRGDGKFYPNDSVTREEFVKIIVEAFDVSKDHDGADFADVQNNRWSYDYIAAAVKAGIVLGDSETTFNPTGKMSRQDMAVIIYRTAKALGFELSDDDGADFADITDVADYAKDAVKALCAAGIINGTGDNQFSPKGIVTRAQAAKIVYEALMAMGGTK